MAQSCPSLCDPMDCTMPGFPDHCQLSELVQTHPLHQWRHPTISSSVILFSSCLQSIPESGSFPVSQFFSSGSPSIGVSASASVLSMNIQDWFPLGRTGWISFQSKGFSRVFSNTTVQKHQFFSAQPSLWSNSHINMFSGFFLVVFIVLPYSILSFLPLWLIFFSGMLIFLSSLFLYIYCRF